MDPAVHRNTQDPAAGQIPTSGRRRSMGETVALPAQAEDKAGTCLQDNTLSQEGQAQESRELCKILCQHLLIVGWSVGLKGQSVINYSNQADCTPIFVLDLVLSCVEHDGIGTISGRSTNDAGMI